MKAERFYEACDVALKQCHWIYDETQRTALAASASFSDVWGAAPEILLGDITGFMKSVYPEDKDRILSDFHLALDRRLSSEFRVIARSGELRFMWLRSFPLSDNCVGFLAQDVTERRQAEAATRTSEATILGDSRSAAASELAGGVAHEINNPLTIILGKASALKLSVQRDAINKFQAIETLEKIETMAIRISEIVTSLQQLARENSLLEFKTTSFSEVFSSINDVASERFRVSGIELALPEFPAQFAAEMHSTLIGQVFLNLLNNAFDAVQSQNGRERWVRVDWTSDDDSAFIYVTDSGPGIPLKLRGRIFDPFFTTKNPDKGTGLGLSLSLDIVARHHGTLRLDSFYKQTRFVVQLPLRRAKALAA